MSDNSIVNKDLLNLGVQTTSSIEGPLRKKPKTGDQGSLRQSRQVHRRQPQSQSQSRQLKNRKAYIDDSNASILDKRSIPPQVENRGTSNECQTNNLMLLADAAVAKAHIEKLAHIADAAVEKPAHIADAAVEKLAHIPPREVISHQSPDSSALACDAIEEASILPHKDLGRRALQKNSITLEYDNCYALTVNLPDRDIRIKIRLKTFLHEPNELDDAKITLPFIINCLVGDFDAVEATLDDQAAVGKLDLNQEFCVSENDKQTQFMTIVMHLLAKHCIGNSFYVNALKLSDQICFRMLKAMFSNKKHFIDLTLRDRRKNSMLQKAINSTFLSDAKSILSDSDRQCIITLILNYQFGTHDRIDIDAQASDDTTVLHKIIKLNNSQINPILDILLKNAPKSPKLVYEREQVELVVDQQMSFSRYVNIKTKHSILHELLSKISDQEACIKDIFQAKGIDIEQVKTNLKQFSEKERIIIHKLPVFKKAFIQLLGSIDNNNKDVLYCVVQGLNIQAYATSVLDSQQDKAIFDKLESLYTQWGESSEETVDQLHAS